VAIYSTRRASHQDHASMNAQVLSNPFSRFWCNEKKTIIQTKTYVRCEWDHLWNDAPQIKTSTNAHIGKSCFFQVAHSIKHSNTRCGVHPPHVMTKLERDENLVGLVWANKVFCAKDFNLFEIVEIERGLHPKRNMKRKSLDLRITMNYRWFMASKFHHIKFSFQICIVLQTCIFQIIFIRICCMFTLEFEIPLRKPS